MKARKIKKQVDTSEFNTKRVQFRIDMKSRSISRSDSRQKRFEQAKYLRAGEQLGVIDPANMSFEKRIEESAANNTND